MSRAIRVSVKAVAVVGGRILLIRNRDSDGDWYSLPGGGQGYGETLAQALERECLEETGLSVRPGRLLFVRDYIAAHHEFAEEDPGAHQVELVFACELEGASEPRALRPDETQVGVEWIELGRLAELRMYPRTMAAMLKEGLPSGGPVYLGDVN